MEQVSDIIVPINPKSIPYLAKFWEPKYVMQKTGNCAQCCIAMITHLPLEVVIQTVGHNKGMRDREIIQALHLLGYECNFKMERGVLPELCILISGRGKYGNHASVYHKGLVYDPSNSVFEFNTINLNKYRFKVKGYIKVEIPVIPECLQKYR